MKIKQFILRSTVASVVLVFTFASFGCYERVVNERGMGSRSSVHEPNLSDEPGAVEGFLYGTNDK